VVDNTKVLKTPHGTQTSLTMSVVIHAIIVQKAGMTIQMVNITEKRTLRFLTFCYNQNIFNRIMIIRQIKNTSCTSVRLLVQKTVHIIRLGAWQLFIWTPGDNKTKEIGMLLSYIHRVREKRVYGLLCITLTNLSIFL